VNIKTPPANWLKAWLKADQSEIAAIEAAMWDAGAQAVTLVDAEDTPIHEPLPGSMPLWPRTVVEALYATDTDRELIRSMLTGAGLKDAASRLQFDTLANNNWETAWMNSYEPMRFGHSLWICPSHIEPDPDWPLVIRLDPGVAFGSGTHPTTALCLEWVENRSMTGMSVLDYGCGSGVLSLAAALKGASRLVAVDHDPQALESTAENARRNNLDGHIEVLLPKAYRELADNLKKFDVILANILAEPLIKLAPLLMDSLKPGGKIVLSGILGKQAHTVAATYADLGSEAVISEREGWVRIVLTAPTVS